MAPLPILPPFLPSQRRVDARHCARLPALIATLASPDREIVLLGVVAGVSVPGIVAALGVTPAAIRLAQDRALSALQPAATANGPLPASRRRVVRDTGKMTRMNIDDGDMWLEALDECDRVAAVGRFSDDLNVLCRAQQSLQARPNDQVIVGEYDADDA